MGRTKKNHRLNPPDVNGDIGGGGGQGESGKGLAKSFYSNRGRSQCVFDALSVELRRAATYVTDRRRRAFVHDIFRFFFFYSQQTFLSLPVFVYDTYNRKTVTAYYTPVNCKVLYTHAHGRIKRSLSD